MALAVVSLYCAVGMMLAPLRFGYITNATNISTSPTTFSTFSIVVGLLGHQVYVLDNTGDASAEASADPARSL